MHLLLLNSVEIVAVHSSAHMPQTGSLTHECFSDLPSRNAPPSSHKTQSAISSTLGS